MIKVVADGTGWRLELVSIEVLHSVITLFLKTCLEKVLRHPQENKKVLNKFAETLEQP